jgi:hypothetical protein
VTAPALAERPETPETEACRVCSHPLILTRYYCGHPATRYGGDKHLTAPAARPARTIPSGDKGLESSETDLGRTPRQAPASRPAPEADPVSSQPDASRGPDLQGPSGVSPGAPPSTAGNQPSSPTTGAGQLALEQAARAT